MMRSTTLLVGSLVLVLETVASAQSQPELFGATFSGKDGPATLHAIDASTGAATPIGPIGFERCSALGFDTVSEILYGVCQRTDPSAPPELPDDDGVEPWVLVRIDPSTGAGTEVGPTAPVPASDSQDKGAITDVAFCGPFGSLPAGTLFAADGAPNVQSLNSIDVMNGMGARIGLNGSASGGNALACSPDGPLLHFNSDGGSIRWQQYNEDTITGELNGSMGLVANVALPAIVPSGCIGRLNAAALDPAAASLPVGSGRLVFASLNCGLGGTGQNFLVRLDVDSPSAVAHVVGPTVDGLDAVAFVTETEEETAGYSCVGFDPPMHNPPVKAKKNKALPLKAELADENGDPIADLDVASPPVVQVTYVPAVGSAVDVSADAVSSGKGTDGNQFEFGDDKWQFNLKIVNYTASGTYTVSMTSGDTSEYSIDPTCTTSFVID